MVDDDKKQDFEREILAIARVHKRGSSIAFADATPATKHADLRRLEKALTALLQVLLPLELRHRYGQDIELEPYNWPLAKDLSRARMSMEVMRRRGLPDPSFERFAYPSQLIADLVELRDAARFAVEEQRPNRGNSSRRTPRLALVYEVGTDFVYRYRGKFGHMPPMTKSGWVVDLLSKTLAAAGIEDADAGELLRRCIENDTVGRSLLPSASAKRAAKRRSE